MSCPSSGYVRRLISEPDNYLRELVEFIGVPYRPEIATRTAQRIDFDQNESGLRIDWAKIREHALAVALAESLGYDVSEIDERGLARRYIA